VLLRSWQSTCSQRRVDHLRHVRQQDFDELTHQKRGNGVSDDDLTCDDMISRCTSLFEQGRKDTSEDEAETKAGGGDRPAVSDRTASILRILCSMGLCCLVQTNKQINNIMFVVFLCPSVFPATAAGISRSPFYVQTSKYDDSQSHALGMILLNSTLSCTILFCLCSEAPSNICVTGKAKLSGLTLMKGARASKLLCPYIYRVAQKSKPLSRIVIKSY